jgi:hypothetical protein
MNDTHTFYWHKEPYATTKPPSFFFLERNTTFIWEANISACNKHHNSSHCQTDNATTILTISSTTTSIYHNFSRCLSIHTWPLPSVHHRLLPQFTRLKAHEETKLKELRVHLVWKNIFLEIFWIQILSINISYDGSESFYQIFWLLDWWIRIHNRKSYK